MTDIDGYRDSLPPTPQESRREGAEDMRERAARVCIDRSYGPDVESGRIDARSILIEAAAAIRKLEVE